MGRILLSLLTISMLFACSNPDLTEQQVYKIIEEDSITTNTDFLELNAVTIKTSSWADNKFKALLQIDFYSNQETVAWDGKGDKDFIPAGMKLNEGLNSVEVTATFAVSYAGDGSYYIEKFSF